MRFPLLVAALAVMIPAAPALSQTLRVGDLDHDGIVSAAERDKIGGDTIRRPQRPAPAARPKALTFSQADANRDGKVTAPEIKVQLPGARADQLAGWDAAIAAADANRDGALSPHEWEALRTPS